MSRDHHPPCPCGKELADECMCPNGDPLGSMRITRPEPNPFHAPRTHYSLADLYDADLRTADPVARRLASELPIPHPLYEVQYADGVLADTTAGRVHSHGRRVSW